MKDGVIGAQRKRGQWEMSWGWGEVKFLCGMVYKAIINWLDFSLILLGRSLVCLVHCYPGPCIVFST